VNNGKKTAYVIGAGGHAKVIIRALEDLGYAVVAVFDDDSRKWGTALLGAPVIGPVQELEGRRNLPAVLAVGDNRARRTLAERFEFDWLTVVHPAAIVDRTARLGRGTVVFAGAVIQADAIVGNHVIVNTSASLDHDCIVEDYVHVAPGARLAGDVSIEEGVLVGTGAVVIPRRRIGAWTTVGAGATVIHDLPPSVTAVGAPARVRGARGPATAIPNAAAPAAGRLAERIYLSPPHMSTHERELLLEAFDSNWIAPLGPQVDAFENEFASKLGVGEAVALASGTAALHLALLLLDVGPGDEVATSTLTFAASANAIRYVGASPVFIDSENRTWNLDPDLLAEELEAAVRRGRPVKAVLAVDVLGQCADYEPILKTCRFYGVPVIEDAAEALGATYRGAAAGTFGDIACFSFNGNKIITTSGGGMLATRRSDLAEKARYLAAQARDPAPQ
jgi:sugar O-acyltransferase (sialic acid O-acetyltransferase NeuD family)